MKVVDSAEPLDLVLERHELLVWGGFGSVSVGLLLAAWVTNEWFVVGVSHVVIAFLAGTSVLFGTQLLVFAFMTSMLITLHREQRAYLRSGER